MSVSQSDARYRSRFHHPTMRQTLARHLRYWFHTLGLQIVLTEGISCLGRIRLQWQTRRDPLLYRKVMECVPPLFLSGDDSRNENYACTLGIQALENQRPWMSLGDIELYLQGWFQAQRFPCRTASSEHRISDLEDPCGSSQNGSGICTGV
jgi:hypothetical protein